MILNDTCSRLSHTDVGYTVDYIANTRKSRKDHIFGIFSEPLEGSNRNLVEVIGVTQVCSNGDHLLATV
jgi:hypothetical protein